MGTQSSRETYPPELHNLDISQNCRREKDLVAPAELGGEFLNVSRNRAHTQVLLQARKLHVYRSGTLGAFWTQERRLVWPLPKDDTHTHTHREV